MEGISLPFFSLLLLYFLRVGDWSQSVGLSPEHLDPWELVGGRTGRECHIHNDITLGNDITAPCEI